MEFLHSTIGIPIFIILSAVICGIKSTDVTFEELERLNVMCNGLNKCEGNLPFAQYRTGLYDIVNGFSCHCDSSCAQLGTCCLDSPFRDKDLPKNVASCRPVVKESRWSYFMIDKCPFNDKTNAALRQQCETMKYSEKDIMSYVPVTSLSSNLTYKNYFCFRCHESNDNYVFWDVKLEGMYKDVKPKFNNKFQAWFGSFPGKISIDVPPEIYYIPRTCIPDLISSCSDKWPMDDDRRKCGMYMSIVNGENLGKRYRNPHCALCNFEDLNELSCNDTMIPIPEPIIYDFISIPIGSARESIQRTNTCRDGFAWDPFYNKCRKLVCAIKDYVIKDGKCTPL